MTKDELIELALEALENNRQAHHYCEDTWYSCPKHEDGCANDAEGDECNCGADKANAEIDKTITTIKEALSQPEQKPVAHFGSAYINENGVHITTVLGFVAIPQDAKLYTTPPQRKPLSEEEIGAILEDVNAYGTRLYTFARAIEAAHGIKV